jgi:hypothetical protein
MKGNMKTPPLMGTESHEWFAETSRGRE